LIFYSGFISFLSLIIIKLMLFKSYLHTLFKVLLKSIKSFLFLFFIGFLLLKIFDINISNKVSIGGLISFLFIFSFNLNDFDDFKK